jgi:RNA polymerase sporulation-specific sigma factor
LTNKDLDELALSYRQRPSDEKAERLMTELDPKVRWVVRTFFALRGHDDEDVRQEAYIALFTSAIPTWDPAKGPFRPFAILCMRRHLITRLKKLTNKEHGGTKTEVSLDAAREHIDQIKDHHEKDDASWAEPVAREEYQPEFGDEYREMLVKIRPELTKAERIVLDLYLSGHTYEEMAEVLSKTKLDDYRWKRRKAGCGEAEIIPIKSVDNALFRIRCKISRKFQDHVMSDGSPAIPHPTRDSRYH